MAKTNVYWRSHAGCAQVSSSPAPVALDVLVVDASFAIEASLTSNGFERLEVRNAIAPALMWSEAASVLHEMQWRRAISRELAAQAFARLKRVPIKPRRPAHLWVRAWEIADNLGLAKTYDAEYIALAQISKCPLLTLDGRMSRVAKDLVEILSPVAL